MKTAAGAISHDALFYDNERTLQETAVEFVRVGVERGEQVLVSTTGNPATSLLRALFADKRSVRFSDGA
ncbi:MAG: MEDS domain-containing protein, partial [Nocardioidaceae bacterium]